MVKIRVFNHQWYGLFTQDTVYICQKREKKNLSSTFIDNCRHKLVNLCKNYSMHICNGRIAKEIIRKTYV